MAKPLISEFEAAAMTAMSPTLLRWFTKYAPKSGIKRKLKVAEEKNDAYFFDCEEVVSFDQWLKLPWPAKDGKRPGMPTAIRDEIKTEAGGECAICHSHKDTCEAAHIDPVKQSYNNHPENLIWLCANHHTAYDKGLFGPAEGEGNFVVGFKTVLRRYRVMLWKTQQEASHALFSVLDSCDHLRKQLAAATTEEQISAVQSIAEKTLKKLPKLAAVSKTDPNYANVTALSKGVASLKKAKATLPERLETATTLRSDYIATFGFVVCPLCKGSGHHDFGDCPVCNGDREIEESVAERVEISDFEKVDCPLCKGKGSRNGEDCPACAGEKRIDRRDADNIDVRDFDFVDCPICEGEGWFRGETCRECGGDGEMERQQAARVDIADYRVVTCPLCKGRGHYDNRDCPECGGDGELLARDAAQIELDRYETAKCPLCKGRGRHNGRDCDVCGGEGSVERRYLDEFDGRDYELVSCPGCNGKGYRGDFDCSVCGGERKIERRYADRFVPRELD